MKRHFRPPVLSLLVLILAAGGVAAAAVSASTARSAKAPPPARLGVSVEVLRFSSAGRSLSASGLVTAKLTDDTGHTRTLKTRVALTAAAGGRSCQVLHLFLNQLNLSLLGLNAHLDKVVLDITGNPGGGVLGTLFCKLARAKVASAGRAADTRAINAAVRRNQGHVLRFTANLNPAVTSAPGAGATCPVLDLIVGPLNLQLLGLVVNLNQVHLTVTATRGGGVLGDLFCQLANSKTTTTNTTTTTTTTRT